MDITVSEDIDAGFIEDVKNILTDSNFKGLSSYIQHRNTTRLMHSINVAYISWKVAKKLGWDARTAARAGMLHDFCLYDFKDKGKKVTGEYQAFYHPKVAARKSQEIFCISEKERRAILSHMFPLGPLPTSREAWLISFADKLCASMELCQINIALAKSNRIVLSPA